MLAPGDFLTNPVQQAPSHAAIGVATPHPATPIAASTIAEQPKPQPSESRSFLMILLNALGAVHT